ncbi:hypothetical protein EON63_02965 [archaeon]|nr:MAG: hypothetical protein EON63_02965 [archaeon]
MDFAITQFYRVLLDDILLLYDAYRIYARNRKYSERTFKEFSEVKKSVEVVCVVIILILLHHVYAQALVDLTETEAQNFEDIDVKKLTKDQEESVRTIVWDYLHSVIIRYLLDDASQVRMGFWWWFLVSGLVVFSQRYANCNYTNGYMWMLYPLHILDYNLHLPLF